MMESMSATAAPGDGAAVGCDDEERGFGVVKHPDVTRGDQKDDESHPSEIDYPSWKTAYALCPQGDLREPLMELTGMDGRLRDSVAITMKKAVARSYFFQLEPRQWWNNLC
jgi:hypothetical protein